MNGFVKMSYTGLYEQLKSGQLKRYPLKISAAFAIIFLSSLIEVIANICLRVRSTNKFEIIRLSVVGALSFTIIFTSIKFRNKKAARNRADWLTFLTLMCYIIWDCIDNLVLIDPNPINNSKGVLVDFIRALTYFLGYSTLR